MTISGLNSRHRLTVFCAHACGRHGAHFLMKSRVVRQRPCSEPLFRRTNVVTATKSARYSFDDAYIRCNTPSRLLGWR